MRASEIMTSKVETVAAAATVESAVEQMRRKRIHHLVVMDNGKLAGIVSDGDLRALPSESGRCVQDVMSSPAVAATPEMPVRKLANLLRGRSVGCLPVLDEGRLVGIVTASDLLEQIGRGAERPIVRGKRWTLKGRGPRRPSVVGRRNFASH